MSPAPWNLPDKLARLAYMKLFIAILKLEALGKAAGRKIRP